MTTETIDQDVIVLTTVDNPYNPKTDYVNWQIWDHENGYDTEQYLARIIMIDNPNIDIDDEVALKQASRDAIQSILDNDVINVYAIV